MITTKNNMFGKSPKKRQWIKAQMMNITNLADIAHTKQQLYEH